MSPYKILFLSYTYRNRLRDNNAQVCISNNKIGYNSSPTTSADNLHRSVLFKIFQNDEKKTKFIIFINLIFEEFNT